MLAVVRTDEPDDNFYETSDDGKSVTNVAQRVNTEHPDDPNGYNRLGDYDKVAAVFRSYKLHKGDDNGYGIKNDKLTVNQSTNKSSARIILQAYGNNGQTIFVRPKDRINPRGASSTVVMPSGILPAPAQDQGKANLPSGAFPANLRGSFNKDVFVTDRNGNFIPIEKRIPTN